MNVFNSNTFFQLMYCIGVTERKRSNMFFDFCRNRIFFCKILYALGGIFFEVSPFKKVLFWEIFPVAMEIDEKWDKIGQLEPLN